MAGINAESSDLDEQAIARANFDLNDRMVREGVTLCYDAEDDILSIVIGEPCEALTEQVVDTVFCRIEPDTLKIVGFEIVQFHADFLRNNKLFRLLIHEHWPELEGRHPQKIAVAEPMDRQRIANLMAPVVAG